MRALVSCRLDGAISQFEIALASAHLQACADCAAFEAEVGAFTTLLREAPPQRSSRPLSVPHRYRLRRPLVAARAVAATAAVAIGAAAIGGSAQLERGGVPARVAAPVNDTVRLHARSADADSLVSIRMLNRDALRQGALAILPVPDQTLGVVKPVLPAANV